MTDSSLVWHIALGLLVLNGTTTGQLLWLAAFVVGWLFSVATAREQARALFVPGAGA